ncbi:MAG: DNA repair protein RecN [Neisseria sp.]|nr:DNA repair protein RecN [Neisseria sp.]
MLLALSLKDFVIVDSLNIELQPGFTVLTGETGAGKSITLDAIGLLLGDKADYGQIRAGAKEACLSALFDLSGLDGLKTELRAQGLLAEDAEELSLRRIIDTKGKSRSYINGQAATLAQLKSIGGRLIDIHGQNTHHSLNHEAAQRELLDAFAGCTALAAEVKAAHQGWQQAEKALQQAASQSETLQIERERLEWQYNELSRLQPRKGEWEEVSSRHDSLAHAAELLEAAEEAAEIIDGDKGLQHYVYRCLRLLEPLSGIEPGFAESLQLLASVEAELGEISAHMRHTAAKSDIDPSELAAQEERMGELMNMARKYRIEPQELPARLADIENALNGLEAACDTEALKRQAACREQAYREKAAELTLRRREAAGRLAAETTSHMWELAMKGAEFHIELLPSAPSAGGLEQIQYQVAANKGSPLRPLNKVASGGELARISLALQVVTGQYTRVPTLIFDEVDTGIGGGTAETVGRALRALGGKHQVLAVTHLPQVAACGQQHWQVSKNHEGEQTVSRIGILDESARIEEIARMLGGEILTDTTRRHAAELLHMAAENRQKAV